MKKTLLICTILCILPKAIQSQSLCESFACTDYSQGKIFIFEKGRIVREHAAPLSNDLWVLDNGNLLFTTGHGVLEINRANDTIFHYTSESYIFACQRLKNGNTFIGESNTGRLLEVSPRREIVKEICILPDGVKDGGKAFMRNARKLDNGHYLVAHYGGKNVTEYDQKGRPCWTVPVSGGAHSVIRLPNGNTLVSVADADKNPRILEFNKKKKIVWEFSNKDLEGAPLKFLCGMQYLPGQGLLFTNWQGHGVNEKLPLLFFVDRDKNVRCTFGPHDSVETLSSVYVTTGNSKKVFH